MAVLARVTYVFVLLLRCPISSSLSHLGGAAGVCARRGEVYVCPVSAATPPQIGPKVGFASSDHARDHNLGHELVHTSSSFTLARAPEPILQNGRGQFMASFGCYRPCYRPHSVKTNPLATIATPGIVSPGLARLTVRLRDVVRCVMCVVSGSHARCILQCILQRLGAARKSACAGQHSQLTDTYASQRSSRQTTVTKGARYK